MTDQIAHSTRSQESLHSLLAEPFPDSEVRTRPGGGGIRLRYITARSAMTRLDDVVGPANWRESYRPWGQDALICRIEIRIGDEWVGKEGIGGRAEMPNADDSDKSVESHAFKRACVKWGVGRYLYGDSIGEPGSYPDRGGTRRTSPDSRGAPYSGEVDINPPTSGRALFAKLSRLEKQTEIPLIRRVNSWAKEKGFEGRMIDYPRDMVSDAWVFASTLLPLPAVSAREPGQDG